ncbi:MAG TPA: hypothetical protein VIZ18_12990 [Ktedonobacteraceae bacterium]
MRLRVRDQGPILAGSWLLHYLGGDLHLSDERIAIAVFNQFIRGGVGKG